MLGSTSGVSLELESDTTMMQLLIGLIDLGDEGGDGEFVWREGIGDN